MKNSKKAGPFTSIIINISSSEEAIEIRNEIVNWLLESRSNFEAWKKYYEQQNVPGNPLSASRETDLEKLKKMREYMNFLINKD